MNARPLIVRGLGKSARQRVGVHPGVGNVGMSETPRAAAVGSHSRNADVVEFDGGVPGQHSDPAFVVA